MRPPPSESDPQDDGFALVLVLWILLLAGAIGTAVTLNARATRAAANTERGVLGERLLSDGAINRVIAALLDPEDELRFALDGAPRTLSLLGRVVTLRVESEAGKIDLNEAPEPLLRQLFLAAALTSEDANTLASNVVKWRSPAREDEAQVPIYREDGRLYLPRFAPFRSVPELRLVRGVTAQLFERLAALVTVWSHDASVDRSVASDALLSILQDTGDVSAQTQMAARARGDAAIMSRLPGLGEALTIRAYLQEGDLMVSRVAVIQIAGDRREPFKVLSWH